MAMSSKTPPNIFCAIFSIKFLSGEQIDSFDSIEGLKLNARLTGWLLVPNGLETIGNEERKTISKMKKAFNETHRLSFSIEFD